MNLSKVAKDILNDESLNWQHNFMGAWAKYKEKNPVIAILILKFINWVIPVIFAMTGTLLITTARVNVKMEPSPKAALLVKYQKEQ